jgi:hypothetical protein
MWQILSSLVPERMYVDVNVARSIEQLRLASRVGRACEMLAVGGF